jgi:tetratricopeptide (TPR) repeat protein
LSEKTKRIQPYSVSDGEYVTLVEFALEAVRFLDRSYKPQNIWSERAIKCIPSESETTQFNLGEESIHVEVIYRIGYEPGTDIHVEDEVSVICMGLPIGTGLKLRVLRQDPNPRFIEIEVSGSQHGVEMILREFGNRFGSEHIPEEKHLEYLLRSAKAASAIGAWRMTESCAQRALQHDQNNPEALMYLGAAKAAQGFEPEGENQLLASLVFNPSNAETYYNLGLIVMKQGRCILASEAFKRSLAIESNNHAFLYRLGQSLERLGDLEGALKMYQQAIQHHPDPELSWIHLGLDLLEEIEESIQRVQSAIRDSSQSENIPCADRAD